MATFPGAAIVQGVTAGNTVSGYRAKAKCSWKVENSFDDTSGPILLKKRSANSVLQSQHNKRPKPQTMMVTYKNHAPAKPTGFTTVALLPLVSPFPEQNPMPPFPTPTLRSQDKLRDRSCTGQLQQQQPFSLPRKHQLTYNSNCRPNLEPGIDNAPQLEELPDGDNAQNQQHRQPPQVQSQQHPRKQAQHPQKLEDECSDVPIPTAGVSATTSPSTTPKILPRLPLSARPSPGTPSRFKPTTPRDSPPPSGATITSPDPLPSLAPSLSKSCLPSPRGEVQAQLQLNQKVQETPSPGSRDSVEVRKVPPTLGASNVIQLKAIIRKMKKESERSVATLSKDKDNLRKDLSRLSSALALTQKQLVLGKNGTDSIPPALLSPLPQELEGDNHYTLTLTQTMTTTHKVNVQAPGNSVPMYSDGARIMELEAENRKCDIAVQKLHKKMTELQEEVNYLQNDVKEKNASLQYLEEQNYLLNSKLNEARSSQENTAQLEQLQSQNNLLQQKCQEQQKQVKAITHEYKLLKEEYQRQAGQHRRQMPEKPRAPDRNGELSRENKKLRDEVSSLTRQLQASNHVKELQKEKERNLRERNTEITKDNRKLREDILSLTQQLDSAQAELLREKQSFLEAMEELSEDELKEKMVTIYLVLRRKSMEKNAKVVEHFSNKLGAASGNAAK